MSDINNTYWFHCKFSLVLCQFVQKIVYVCIYDADITITVMCLSENTHALAKQTLRSGDRSLIFETNQKVLNLWEIQLVVRILFALTLHNFK